MVNLAKNLGGYGKIK